MSDMITRAAGISPDAGVSVGRRGSTRKFVRSNRAQRRCSLKERQGMLAAMRHEHGWGADYALTMIDEAVAELRTYWLPHEAE